MHTLKQVVLIGNDVIFNDIIAYLGPMDNGIVCIPPTPATRTGNIHTVCGFYGYRDDVMGNESVVISWGESFPLCGFLIWNVGL